MLVFLELDRRHLGIGNLGALLEALLCPLPITSDCKHAPRARHLELEIHITWSSHEAGIGRSVQNGVISTLKIHNLKR